jgi:uroporphyrinogen-III decarboxylase
MCYAVEGQVLKALIKPKVLFLTPSSTCFITKNYRYHYFIPKRKVKAGVNAVQIFDSWGNVISS